MQPFELESCPLGERYQPEEDVSMSEDDQCVLLAQPCSPPDYGQLEPSSWISPGMVSSLMPACICLLNFYG